ncbi:FAD/NAD(P)-binding domain-containing protein [Nemania sp. NC0429]|nr:FAD/NAD(P)-binding domain-containing protein [Nemania sp. NC0429]
MSSSATTPPIAIVGAGPCGVTLARLLELAHVPYVVFERNDASSPYQHQQGGTLDIHTGTGQAALEAAGLKAEFLKFARYEAATFALQDATGTLNFRAGGDGTVGADFLSDRPEIDRYQLQKILLDSIPADRVRWGKALRAVERADGAGSDAGAAGWVLRFADGSEETGFRMIVGADGGWSKVRPLLTSAKPYYSGKSFIEGRIPQTNPMYAKAQEIAGAGSFSGIGAGRMLAVQQVADRSYRMYAGVEKPESLMGPGGALDFAADPAKAQDALRGLYADWAPHLRAFVDAAEGPWRIWPLYTFDPEVFSETGKKTWTRVPGVTLVGDAAHLGIPNGEGVNIAMLDALRLFESLSAELGFGDGKGEGEGGFDAKADAAAVERAIVAYETPMRERALEHVSGGIKIVGEMMFQADGAERMLDMVKHFADSAGQS